MSKTDAAKRIERDRLYGVVDLKERGWTDTAIKRYLPSQPDDTRPNPHYSRAGAPMKFWTRVRVHRVESTKRFLAWREGVSNRRASATAAVSTRVDRMTADMLSVELVIKRGLTDDQIFELAAATHGGNYLGDPGAFRPTRRTMRNCIRHQLTNYEVLWTRCNRGETGRAAYEILRARVDALIDEAYPQYAESVADNVFVDSTQS